MQVFSSKLALPTLGFLGYLVVVRTLRWRRYKAVHKKYLPKLNDQSLTVEEAHEVVQLAFMYDMPLLSEYSLAFALFKTYAIPTISKLLSETKQLASTTLVARRYADTELLIANWLACPLFGRKDDPRAALALARVNWLHSKYKISNEDYLYTLGLFTFEPATFAARYGWREHSQLEKYAAFVYWSEVGRRMNIENIPPTIQDFKAWIQTYEKEYMVPAQTNHEVANQTINELLFIVPHAFGLRRFAEGLTRSVLEDRVRIAMMQPEAPWYAKYVVNGSMWLFAFTHKHLLLPRRKPGALIKVELPKPWYKPRGWGFVDWFLVFVRWHDDVPRPEYRCGGYRIHEMGPPRFEQDGHEQVFKMAEALQGCPISDAWKTNKEG
ncbi:hypothetical protein FB45DRAFT_976236 [Roridomyces roridus]|uniref:ER-bound oxygenase mpaB/mpaB'/Rubber oxygenase catalytic domain-containing protein n=1 Tax=Roridomyces roridus TaxID=1738132 RepID=A0AAD7C7M3_9AGAR|nr:hypothetical protein FB45DRAFT_976236 [Roridomyces roridus]